MKKIRVLIVEDSIVAAELLKNVFLGEGSFEVVGIVGNGQKAVDIVQTSKPDIVSMDINMPVMDGFEATRIIMETNPVPIIIVSASWEPGEVEMTFKAMQAGALTVIQKPRGIGSPYFEKDARNIHRLFKALAEVKVVRRYADRKHRSVSVSQNNQNNDQYQCVAIGVSTGGPTVLNTILKGLDKDFRLPILIVQHIADGFIYGFVKWLRDNSGYNVQIAKNGDELCSGIAYMAPENMHLEVYNNRIKLTDGLPVRGNKPSVSNLFVSVGQQFENKVIAVLLTGMGNDGSQELKELKEKGALTIIQSEESSLIFGMPGEARRINAECFELTPEQIAVHLNTINKKLK